MPLGRLAALGILVLLDLPGRFTPFGPRDARLHAAEPEIAPPRLEIAGVTVTPHVRALSMRYRREPDPELGARVQVFLRNASRETVLLPAGTPPRFDGKLPEELVSSGEWTWHDTPDAWPGEDLSLPPGTLTVWTFNGRTSRWLSGQDVRVETEASRGPISVPIARRPRAWLSAVTFLSTDGTFRPDSLIFHVANESGRALRIASARLWLPAGNDSWRALLPREPLGDLRLFPADGVIPPGDRGGASARTGALPLSYAALEVRLDDAAGGASTEARATTTLWAHLRVKREAFDLSGGWVNGSGPKGMHLAQEPFLRTLRRLHINTAHIGRTTGYTDQDGPDGLYTRFPLKYFGELRPFEEYDTDVVLPRIHAVEFLGEPQYGGGRPVPPMEVWRKLAPYARTRLPTTVTHSEERVWRLYAGLSDFPHYDAYRVSAPAADSWRRYDRWGGAKIGWGAPLETIGDMCRSLREMSRPASTAYWSQGPHHDWDVYDGRRRTTPTPDEMRLQAYHALSTRVTSLYWFNLSLRSLVKWRDTIDELGRIGRETRLLEDFYLEGDAYRHERQTVDSRLDWDLASIASPRGALLFALDLDYAPDPAENVFRFGPPREARWIFHLPRYLRGPADVFRVDADGIRDVTYKVTESGIEISDRASRVAVYVASPRKELRGEFCLRLESLRRFEDSMGFDPARVDADFEALRALLGDR